MPNPIRTVAVQSCTAEQPMPRGISSRDLVRWEHPELRRRPGSDTLTSSCYACPHCGIKVYLPLNEG